MISSLNVPLVKSNPQPQVVGLATKVAREATTTTTKLLLVTTKLPMCLRPLPNYLKIKRNARVAMEEVNRSNTE